MKVVVDNWIIWFVVFAFEWKNNCEHKLEHVTNQLWKISELEVNKTRTVTKLR